MTLKAGNADPISIIIPCENETREMREIPSTDARSLVERKKKKKELEGSDNRKLAYSRQKGMNTDEPRDAAILHAALQKSTYV